MPRLDLPQGSQGAGGGRGHPLGFREGLHQGRGLRLEGPHSPGERGRRPREGALAHRGQGVRRPRRRLHALSVQRVGSARSLASTWYPDLGANRRRENGLASTRPKVPVWCRPRLDDLRSRSSRSHLPPPARTFPRPLVPSDTTWLRRAFAALVGQIGPETDQLILRARASGERWVAAVRFFLVAGLSVLVVAMAPAQRWTGLTLLLLVGLVHALLLAWLAFHVAEPWVPWLSCAADVALTTAALLFVLRNGGAGAALPTRTLYELYFLVIMSAGLRYDWRLCIWTAGLCVVAHAILLWLAAGPLGVEGADGGVGRASQAVHFVMLALGGIIMAAVAQRAK